MTTILVIDDNNVTRMLTARIISKHFNKYEVVEAEDGKTGIQLALDTIPDLIVCDIMMPDIDGYDVLSQVRSNHKCQTVPFIFLTGESNFNNLRKAMNLGADDYLTKPFTAKDLINAVITRLKRFDLIKQHYVDELTMDDDYLDKQLNHNSLTNLPNRFSLREKFHQVINESNKTSGKFISVITIKLEKFDDIINEFGYGISDNLLIKFSKRLLSLVGNDNIVFHVNNDEFVIILIPLKSKKIITNIVSHMSKELLASFDINNQEIFIAHKMGIAVYPNDGKEIEILVPNSQKAIAQLDDNSKVKYNFYSPIFNSKNTNHNNLEKDFSQAIEKDQLKVYYQPQLDVKENQITSGEAFIFWHHPQLDLIPASQFLPLAEEHGLIEFISEWLLSQICKDLKNIQNKGFADFNIAVNVFLKHFKNTDFNQKLMKLLSQHNLPAHCFSLEITEDLLVENNPVIMGKLDALKTIGIKIVLNNFGTGYSSLNYFQSFPLNTIKIDRNFIKNIDTNSENFTTTRAIMYLAHQLDLSVIAEGVETETELKCLQNLKCNMIQGEFLNPPLPFTDFVEFLENYK